MALDEGNEVLILAYKDDALPARGIEDCPVVGVAQPVVAQGNGFESESLCKPTCDRRWKLRIEPESHAARRAMSIRCAAKRKAARMSSCSRSG